jgi:hypothetical protein
MTDSAYYNSAGRKIIDFVIGFFGITGLVVAVGVALVAMGGELGSILFAVLLDLGAITFCFVSGRRFMGWGMLCAWLVPLLAVGACFMVLANTHW